MDPDRAARRAELQAAFHRATDTRPARRFPVMLPAQDAPTCPECARLLTHYGNWSYACKPCSRGYVVPPTDAGAV